ncbi:uncharacterized protein LOC110007281 [Amborella trichopoda]|uniref:uncharacterized protein LOC110007281 n=1 Tax=Amborella trichopoda TaxID=13333 RepID=UPI0009C14A38|nr:uncharacterized protein LOC110007281 [Amborella trichopoda]|eukprot:XP_020522941.1 uncharacterized protein LOC110007281 [Amborella trichopoda]
MLATGSLGKEVAVKQKSKIPPGAWWMGHGGSPPHLRQMAMKILNMTCSSSGCEPNVSAFAMVHTKKRNILEKRQLNDLVFVQYNQKLQERHPQLEHDQREAIEAFGIDDACEWLVDASDDEVFLGEGLIWG